MLIRLPRLRTLAVMACVAGAVPVVASSTVATAAPSAGAASLNSKYTHTCKVAKYPGSGYFNSLKTYRRGCSSGRKVMVNHHKCRIKHGKKGHCGKTSGYKCTEYRPKSGAIATQYNARVTCKKISKVTHHQFQIKFTYQQDL